MSNVFQYRKDIDGLRAIAVLIVVAFHAKYSAISGGFIGVDVFFVISGFLISVIIAKEHAQGEFTFASFYVRRIKRLAPALITMLLLTTIPAYLILFPDDFEIFGRSQIHAFITTSNFFLWQNTGGYFSPNTDLFPLLHTWSLAVEEQFYFIWPSLFLLMHKITRGEYLTRLMSLFLIGLLFYSVYLANHSPHSAYFLLPARAFELMMGAMLAVSYHKLPTFKSATNHVVSLIGLTLILVPAFIISKQSIFPGLNAFWPCLGTVLLIISGKNMQNPGIVNKIISHRLFVFIGLISYSLYLWHWPIFSFIQYLGLDLKGLLRIFALIASFMLAYLSWRFVEQPVRHWQLPTLKGAMLKIMLPSFLVFTVVYGAIDGTNGFPHRFEDLQEFDKTTNFPSTVRKKCFDADLIGNIEDCWLGIDKEKTELYLDGMLIGDSYANHSAAFVDVLAKDAGLMIHDSTSGGHPVLTRILPNGEYDYDPKYAEKRLDYAMQFEHIILAAIWDYYSEPDNINYEFILKTIGRIVEAGKKVFVIISLPPTTEQNLHRLKLEKASPLVFFDKAEKMVEIPRIPESHIINEMRRRYPMINFIDFRDVMCDQGRCNLIINDTIIYRNADHFNISGARMMAEKYLENIGNPFKEKSVDQLSNTSE